MSKITLVFLAAGAFLYAAWLTLFRRDLPDPASSRGLRRRFILATLLFVGLLSLTSCKDDPQTIMCYAPMRSTNAPPVQGSTTNNAAVTLKAVWRTLDPGRSQEFRSELAKAVDGGEIRQRVADVLSFAFAEIAAHRSRTRGTGLRTTCYEMTQLGGQMMATRENALKQIELLAKAREAGTIDEETSKKAYETLAQQIEDLSALRDMTGSDWRTQAELLRSWKDRKQEPADSVRVAASMIVEMEGGITVVSMPEDE